MILKIRRAVIFLQSKMSIQDFRLSGVKRWKKEIYKIYAEVCRCLCLSIRVKWKGLQTFCMNIHKRLITFCHWRSPLSISSLILAPPSLCSLELLHSLSLGVSLCLSSLLNSFLFSLSFFSYLSLFILFIDFYLSWNFWDLL